MPKVADKLAFALSSSEALSRALYKRVFDRLYITDAVASGFTLDDVDVRRRDTARDLEALAICDFDYGADQVRACPPFLSPLPRPGLPSAILCGARTPDMLRRIRAVARDQRAHIAISTAPQPAFPLLPNRAEVMGENAQALRTFATAAGIALLDRPAAELLLARAATVDAYLAGREWRPATEPNWTRTDFDPRELRFTRPHGDGSSLRCFAHPQLVHQREHLFFEGGRAARVDRDWGRYCALARAGRGVFRFDSARALFFVPVTVPLPRIYARALVLCSGFAAEEVADAGVGPHRVFVRVPKAYAESVATKLQQALAPMTYSRPLRGAHD
jgi:hypothetical protein